LSRKHIVPDGCQWEEERKLGSAFLTLRLKNTAENYMQRITLELKHGQSFFYSQLQKIKADMIQRYYTMQTVNLAENEDV